MQSKFRPFIRVVMVVACIAVMSSVTLAETKTFNVTASNVTGVESLDPYSRRAKKADDDVKFYVTAKTMSGKCPYVKFYMKNFATGKLYKSPMTYYRSSLGNTNSQEYGAEAPKDRYYALYMQPASGYVNINVTGNFTP